MPESDRPQNSWIPRVISCSSVIFFIVFNVQAIVGCVYFNDCPRAPSIPVFMVICGFIPVLWGLSRFLNRCNIFFDCLFSILHFAFFIIGSIIVYAIYEPDYNKNATETDRYCNKTLYLFAFCCITLTYILTAYHTFDFHV